MGKGRTSSLLIHRLWRLVAISRILMQLTPLLLAAKPHSVGYKGALVRHNIAHWSRSRKKGIPIIKNCNVNPIFHYQIRCHGGKLSLKFGIYSYRFDASWVGYANVSSSAPRPAPLSQGEYPQTPLESLESPHYFGILHIYILGTWPTTCSGKGSRNGRIRNDDNGAKAGAGPSECQVNESKNPPLLYSPVPGRTNR